MENTHWRGLFHQIPPVNLLNPMPPSLPYPNSYQNTYSAPFQNPNNLYPVQQSWDSNSQIDVIHPPGVEPPPTVTHSSSASALLPSLPSFTYRHNQAIASTSTPLHHYYQDPNVPLALPPFGTGITESTTVTNKLVATDINSSLSTNQKVDPQNCGTRKKGPKKIKIALSAWCEICKVDCNSKSILDQHKLGKKHKKNLRKLVAENGATPAQTPASANIPAQTTLALPPTPAKAPASVDIPVPTILALPPNPAMAPTSADIPVQSTLALPPTPAQTPASSDIPAPATLALPPTPAQTPASADIPAPATLALPPTTAKAPASADIPAPATLALPPTPAKAPASADIPALPPKASTGSVIVPNGNLDVVKPVSGQKARKKAAANEDLETKKRKLLEGGVAAEDVRLCSMCNVVCNSEMVFIHHLAGQKHATMMKKTASASGMVVTT